MGAAPASEVAPFGQSVHPASPVAFLYVPAAHGEQPPPKERLYPARYFPSGQGSRFEHVVSKLETVSLKVVPAHGTHSPVAWLG